MLIRIDNITVINTQQLVRIYVRSTGASGGFYEVIAETLNHQYPIERCLTKTKAVEMLDKILNQYDRGQRVIKL